jgi:AcrR family transcriptional regulator
MLDAVAQETALRGYERVTVGQIAARAHVSLSTFYEHFTDKQDCFLAAHRALAERLASELTLAVTADPAPAQGWRAGVRALLEFAAREPAAFSLLMDEAIVVGARGMDERDRLIAKLEDCIERAWELVPAGSPVPDLPAKLLLGGIVRSVGVQLRRGEHHPIAMLEDFLRWADAYAVAAGQERRRDTAPSAELRAPPSETPPGLAPPPVLPRGRHRLPVETVSKIQRERIVHAAAKTIAGKDYAEVTVADIVAAAGISREAFYAHFHDKGEAFGGVRELIFEALIAACAGAFFTASTAWPLRVWDAQSALIAFAVGQPSFARFGFLESYALGPESAQRVDEYMLAFTMFLEDGERLRSESPAVSRGAREAIACAMMELYAFYVRHEPGEGLYGLLPLVVYVILTPFMGTDAANEFIDAQGSRTGD